MKSREAMYARKTLVAKLMAEANRPLIEGPTTVGAVEFRRDQYGLNDSEWATVLGMTRGHYCDFKHGNRSLPLSAMVRAFALGVPAECLFQIEPTKGASRE